MKMESIAKVYGVKFVLDVARFGDDPLWQNVSTLIVLVIISFSKLNKTLSYVFFVIQGSLYFQALNIPWYTSCSYLITHWIYTV
jgi:hypothetical protein